MSLEIYLAYVLACVLITIILAWLGWKLIRSPDMDISQKKTVYSARRLLHRRRHLARADPGEVMSAP